MQTLGGLHHGGLTRFHARPVAVARPAHSRNSCLRVNAHASKPTKAQVAVEAADPQESPYFDSLCRSFLLGVGAGALVETVHMVSKLVQTPDVQGESWLLAVVSCADSNASAGGQLDHKAAPLSSPVMSLPQT